MKKLTDLNNRAWYRALKVVYIFFTVVCFLMATGIIIGQTIVMFNDQEQYVETQKNITQRLGEIQKMQDLGYTTTQILDNLKGENNNMRKLIGRLYTLSEEEYVKIYGDKTDPLVKQTKSNKPLSVYLLIVFIPFVILITLLISQIPKWIFYYVYFGKVKPEK